MSNKQKCIKLKPSWSIFGFSLVTLLAMAMLSIVFVEEFINAPSFDFYHVYMFTWPLVVDVILIDLSTRCLIINMEKRTVTFKTVFRRKTIMLSDIADVELPKSKFLGYIKLKKASNGKYIKFFVDVLSDNCIPNEKFAEFIMKGKSDDAELDVSLLDKDPERFKKYSISNKIAALMIAIPIVALYACMFFLHWVGGKPAFPVASVGVHEFASFWVVLGTFVILALIVLIKRKYVNLIGFLALLLFATFLPLMCISGFGFPVEYRISATRDFQNYHEAVDEAFDGDYHYFPEEIQGGEVLAFSYHYDYSWDWVKEMYLEVRYDQEEFDRIYSQYEEKESSYFGEGLLEVTLAKENLCVHESSNGGTPYIDGANLQKIVFDEERCTVIFYYLNVIDPFHIDECYLVEKFDIDIFDYEKYIEEKQEKAH